MIPIRDSVQSRSKPRMVRFIIAINVIVFLFQLFITENQANYLIYVFGFIPAEFYEALTTNPISTLLFYPIITSMFLHGGLSHIVGNMWILWIFGDNVEDKMGHKNFLFFYLLCGIIANLTHFAFNMDSVVPAIGASGAIAGVMGAYFLMFKKATIVTVIPWFPPLFLNVPAPVYLFIWFFSQIYSGTQYILSDGGSAGGIAWWAHIGGFIAGSILYKFFLKKDRYSRYTY